MKTKLSKFIARGAAWLTASVIMIGMFQTGKVFADPSAGLSKSGSAEVGKTISLNVKVSGDGPYGGYNGSVSYDSSFFELAGISTGNYGAANFSKKGTNFLDYNCNIPSGSTIVVIQLKCLKEGTSNVSVSLNVSSLDGEADYSTGASADITVSAPVQLSGNNYLSSLSVAPGSLSPSFNKSTTSYHVTVSDSQTSIAVSAAAEHGKAKVSLNGVQKDLKMGDNTVKVTVTAENGEKRTYKIIVTRGTPTPTPEPYPVIVTNGNSYTILEPESLENIPSGFTWSETTYNSKKVPCLVGPNGTLMMWLLSDAGNGLYIYDLETQTVAPCYTYTTEQVTMMIVPFPTDFVTPNGYEKSTYKIGENDVEVYKNTQQEGAPSLIYLMDKDGNSALYYLDEATNMIMPFRGDLSALIATPTPIPTDTPTPTPSPTPVPATATPVPTEAPSSGNGFKTATILLGIVSVALLAGLVVLIVMRQKDKYAQDDAAAAAEEKEEPKTSEDETKEAESENGDHYYQFGDEPEMRRPGAKRAGETEDVTPEPEKEEPLPDFPEFPERKPEPIEAAKPEKELPAPMITVVDTKETSSDDKEASEEDTSDSEPDEKKDDGSDDNKPDDEGEDGEI